MVKSIPVDLYRPEVCYVAKIILSDRSCLAMQARELGGLGERNPGEAKDAGAERCQERSTCNSARSPDGVVHHHSASDLAARHHKASVIFS